MKLTYQTGIATLIQFLLISLLNIANSFNSIVTTCHRDGGDCISNTIVSIIFFILICCWFGSVWILGYAAQERRSKILARLLICAEALIVLVAVFNAKHHADALSLFISVIDIILAIWVVILAFRLSRHKGGRLVAKQRPRERRKSVAKL